MIQSPYLLDAIANLRPGIQVSVQNDDLARAIVHDGTALPSESEIRAEIDRISVRIKKRKLAEAFRKEGIERVSVHVPEWNSEDKIEVVVGLWPALKEHATQTMTAAMEIFFYTRDIAVPKLRASGEVDLDTVDPTAADPFGDGTAWPK